MKKFFWFVGSLVVLFVLVPLGYQLKISMWPGCSPVISTADMAAAIAKKRADIDNTLTQDQKYFDSIEGYRSALRCCEASHETEWGEPYWNVSGSVKTKNGEVWDLGGRVWRRCGEITDFGWIRISR